MNILMVEDSQEDVVLIERELTRAGIPFNCRVVKTREEFVSSLNEFRCDIVLSDHMLPDFNSLEALEIFRAYKSETGVHVPFVVVTGWLSEEVAVHCMRAGADDFVLKDQLRRLAPSVIGLLEKSRLAEERGRYLRDVVERDALLRETERLARCGSWQVDLTTGKQIWSDGYFHILGMEPGEVTPSYEVFKTFLFPEDIQHTVDRYTEFVARNEEEAEYTFRIRDKFANVKELHCKLRLIRNDSGEVTQLLGLVMDITERVRAADRLLRTRQRYRALFDEFPEPVVSLDHEGRFTNVNPAFEQITGFTKASLVGRHCADVFKGSKVAVLYDEFVSGCRRTPIRYNTEYRNSAGEQFCFDVHLIPIFMEEVLIGIQGIAMRAQPARSPVAG